MLEGRSSLARLGVSVHATAGFGDIGFDGHWTLEISVVKPVLVLPGIEVCQIYFCKPTVQPDIYYTGKYQGSVSVIPSKMGLEL
jgi:dCTP deaminase